MSADGRYIFTISYYEGTLSCYDSQNGYSLSNYSVGPWPKTMGMSPDHTKIVVCYGQDGQPYDEENDGVAVFSISGGNVTLVASITLTNEPVGYRVAFSPDSGYAYIATQVRQSSQPQVYEISLTGTPTVTRSFGIASTALADVVCNGPLVLVSDTGGSKLWAIDRSSWTGVPYSLALAPQTLAMHPSGQYIFAATTNGPLLVLSGFSFQEVFRYSALPPGASVTTSIAFDVQGTRAYLGYGLTSGDLYVLDISGPGVSPMPYGNILAYTSSNELKIIDTIHQTNSTVPLPPELIPTESVWSPDGQWIACAAYTNNNAFLTQIYVLHPDGTGLRRVSDGTKNLTYPDFSPDGKVIACTGVEGDADIYLVNFDGSGTTNLGVSGLFADSEVKWSPDGQKLLFDNWGPPYTSDLFVYDLPTGTFTNITHQQNNEAFSRGAWSPDGTKIVCIHGPDANTNFRVCVMNADGSNPVDLTADWTSDAADPTWSRDGQYILFSSNQDGHYDIWSMWPDGSQRTNLTQSAQEDYYHPDMLLVGPQIEVQPQSQTAAVGGRCYLLRERGGQYSTSISMAV